MMHLMLCVQILQVYDAQMKHSNAGQIRPSADKVVVVACENCRSQLATSTRITT
jgi:Fe-S oxidoreductase